MFRQLCLFQSSSVHSSLCWKIPAHASDVKRSQQNSNETPEGWSRVSFWIELDIICTSESTNYKLYVVHWINCCYEDKNEARPYLCRLHFINVECCFPVMLVNYQIRPHKNTHYGLAYHNNPYTYQGRFTWFHVRSSAARMLLWNVNGSLPSCKMISCIFVQ